MAAFRSSSSSTTVDWQPDLAEYLADGTLEDHILAIAGD